MSNIRDLLPRPRQIGFVIDPAAPYDTAKLFREEQFANTETPTLFYHRGGFYRWTGAAYDEIADADLRAHLYAFLDQCHVVIKDVKDGKDGWHQRPFKPNRTRVGNIIDALQAAANLPYEISAPAWLDGGTDIEPGDIISCANGLLNLETLDLLPHTPVWFSHNSVPFAYNKHAPEPQQWLCFLDHLWPDDPESIAALQEIFGLCLTTETRFQKAFLLIGPKRSGKGTIARVLAALVGRANAASPTLASLGETFGLQPLIGKLLAIISDARLGAKADQHAIAESVLRITGEDDITAARKHREAWTGRFRTRFLVISNELPRLADASGAVASRFIILRLTNSFYGREDLALTERLLSELSAILKWSLTGWRRLKQRGYFQQPASAAEAAQQMEDLSSPIGAFIRECCEIAQGRSVEAAALFEAWCDWCKSQGRDHPGTIQTFGRDLRAAHPSLTTRQARTEPGKQRRFFEGIGLI
jgi:putative DNA primase/helicase